MVCRRGGGTLVASRPQQRQRVHVDRDRPVDVAFFSVMRSSPSGRNSTHSCSTAGRST